MFFCFVRSFNRLLLRGRCHRRRCCCFFCYPLLCDCVWLIRVYLTYNHNTQSLCIAGHIHIHTYLCIVTSFLLSIPVSSYPLNSHRRTFRRESWLIHAEIQPPLPMGNYTAMHLQWQETKSDTHGYALARAPQTICFASNTISKFNGKACTAWHKLNVWIIIYVQRVREQGRALPLPFIRCSCVMWKNTRACGRPILGPRDRLSFKMATRHTSFVDLIKWCLIQRFNICMQPHGQARPVTPGRKKGRRENGTHTTPK